MVTTYPGFRFKYGYIQVVAQIPLRPGLWPALWLAAANLQWPPEMDMLEAWGSGYSAAYYHPVHMRRVRAIIPTGLAFGWHTFALSWTKKQMTWLLDGKVILTVNHHVPHQKMYFIADLAEYRPAASPGKCQGSLNIRSVKVWGA